MPKPFKRLFTWLCGWYNSESVDLIIQMFLNALPYLQAAADIAAGLYHPPLEWDDKLLACIKASFPQLYTGVPLTVDEFKLYTLAVAAELMKAKWPNASTTVARIAAQIAYARHQKVLSQKPQVDEAKILTPPAGS